MAVVIVEEKMVERIPVSQNGYDQLRKQLADLKNVERPRLEKRLGEAREMGDLSENAEFDAAREELWRLDQRVAELEDQLARSEIVSSKRVAQDEVAYGARVKVKDLKFGDIDEYTLCGEGESNPSENRIAITTPIGQGLVGHKVGETVAIQVPAGTLKYEILSINYD